MVKIKQKKKLYFKNEKDFSNKIKKKKKAKANNKNKNNHNNKNKNSYNKLRLFRKKRIISKRNKNFLSSKHIKYKKNKKAKALKSLNLISPFYINNNIVFFYDLEKFEDFSVFTNDINKYKLSENELLFLKKKVNDIENKKNNKSEDSSIKILPEFYDNFKSLVIKPKLSNQTVDIINLSSIKLSSSFELSKMKSSDELLIYHHCFLFLHLNHFAYKD